MRPRVLRLNRTFMELKHKYSWSSTESYISLNRTFMELKPGSVEGEIDRLLVLIVPLWN